MPSDFDIAFPRFGVMFFEDPYQAFSNIYKSLKDNGQLSFVCWQNPSLNREFILTSYKRVPDLPLLLQRVLDPLRLKIKITFQIFSINLILKI